MTFFHTRCRLAAIILLAALTSSPVLAQQLPFEQVVAQLKSPDAGARLSALRLLAESGYPEAAAPIAPLLSDPDARVRREAMSTELGLFVGGEAARKRVALVGSRRDPNAAFRAFEANWSTLPAARVPVDVVTGLLAPLKDASGAIRAEAAYTLGVLGQIDGDAPDAAYRTVVEALAERLGDPDAGVRIAVARAAGRIFRRCPAGCGAVAIDRLGDALIRLLNEPDTMVQGAAMEGLGEIRYDRAVKPLTDLLAYYKGGEMAFGALDTLARIGHASAVPTLRAALASQDPNFRRAAVEGLARSGDKDGAAATDAAGAAERDASVILALAFAQQRSGRANQLPRLVQALAERNLAPQAQEYLVELGRPVAGDLAAALPSASSAARVALLEVLAVTGSPAEAAAIEPLQRDRDQRVAAAAERALARIKRT